MLSFSQNPQDVDNKICHTTPLLYLLSWLLLACTFFLFPIGTKYFCIPIFLVILLSIALQLRLKINPLADRKIKAELIPWMPIALSITVLTCIHGTSGYSIYFIGLALLILGRLALGHFRINEKVAVISLTASLVICCLAIIIYIANYGLGSHIFDINRNILLCGLTLIFSAILGALLTSYHSYTKTEIALIFLCGLLYLAVLSMTQVRTAVLGLVALIPIVIIFSKKSPKIILILFVPLLLLILSFFISDRLQQGLHDLELWNKGNPNSSWGIRLELWKFAVTGFLEHPIFGWGAKPFHEMIDAGLTWRIPSFDASHFHSDIFNNLISNGLLGITGWLITIFLLFKYFWKNSALACLLVTSLAMGLSERIWFDNKACLPILISLWLIFSVSKIHPKQHTK